MGNDNIKIPLIGFGLIFLILSTLLGFSPIWLAQIISSSLTGLVISVFTISIIKLLLSSLGYKQASDKSWRSNGKFMTKSETKIWWIFVAILIGVIPSLIQYSPPFQWVYNFLYPTVSWIVVSFQTIGKIISISGWVIVLGIILIKSFK